MKANNRVVITARGFFSPLGHAEDTVISAIKKVDSLYEPLVFDREVIAAPIKDFDLRSVIGRYKNARYLNRGAAFSLAAAIKTFQASGLGQGEVARAGLFTGAGPNMDIGNEIAQINDGQIGTQGLSALWLLRFLPNTVAAMIADRAGIHGENLTISTACATGIQTLGEAYRKIRDGYLELAFAGSGDSRLNQGGVLAYKMAGALAKAGEDPDKGHRPFNSDRTGFAMGEGGAFFLLESLDHALARNAVILAEIAGFGSSLDAGNLTAPDPSGRWMEKAVRHALNESELDPSQIDLVSAHGTGTDLNDRMEADLLKRVFKDSKPHIIALKSWMGHISAACGAVELAVVLCLMNRSLLPRIRNLTQPICPELNFVRETTEHAFETVLLENFGFGGQNGALVVKKWKRPDTI